MIVWISDQDSKASAQEESEQPQEEKQEQEPKPNSEPEQKESEPQEKKEEEKKEKKEVKKSATKKTTSTNNIRVNLDKIDALMNSVGDLVITNAMLTQYASNLEDIKVRNSVLERLDLLERHIREMQDSDYEYSEWFLWSQFDSKFPKVIRDISKKLNRKQ